MNHANRIDHEEPKAGHAGRWIWIGLGLGILCGIMFGEYCAGMQVIGQAYVGLLQMTVLPYLVVTLICKMGRLDVGQAKRLGLTSAAVMLVMWSIGILLIVLASWILPPLQGASFFSPPLESSGEGMQDVLSRFIPANVFRSLNAEYVPAVVVFCLFFGSALMLVPEKEPLLDFLDVCSSALKQINYVLVRVAPVGLFALTAAAAGTLRLEEISRLQAYLIAFTLVCSIAAFGILPVLVSSTTPIRYRDFLRAMHEPVLIAIATGKLLVTLPQITQKCEELLRADEGTESDSSSSIANVLVPLAYPFPHLGKTLAFVFISFAAWYSGKGLTTLQTTEVAATGTISSFASPLVTMSHLLNEFQLPQDLMTLFILPGFITTRMADVVGVSHLMAFTVIVAVFLGGKVRVAWKTLLTASASLFVCLLLLIGAGRWYIASTTLDYDLDTRFLSLEIPNAYQDVIVYHDRSEVPARDFSNESTFRRIQADKSIRVGYSADAMPYSFVNSQRQLVGLDVQLFHRLAERLQMRLEFVPCTIESAEEQLSNGEIDVIIGGIMMMPERLLRASFTQPYKTATLAVVVRDHRSQDCRQWEQLAKTTTLKLGTHHSDLAAAAKRSIPNARIETVDSIDSFFSSDSSDLDGMIMAAEVGSVWNIFHPEHTVVIPQPIIQRPVCFVVRSDDDEWLRLLDRWLDFEKLEGSVERLSQYWIEGGGTKEKPPRWCIARDVLHWFP